MRSETAGWTELAEFRECEPSALAFRALVALLDTWPGDDLGAAIKSAEDLVSSWPDNVRLAPWSWCKAASRGAVPPTWSLARTLELNPGHLTKTVVNLARLAHFAPLDHITELQIPVYSPFAELSFLYHRPEVLRGLKRLSACDKRTDGEVRALKASPLWNSLESFEIDRFAESLAHHKPSRIVPQLLQPGRIRHLTLRAADLMAVWDAHALPQLESVSVVVTSIDEAEALSARAELSRLKSLSLAFRCGFSGNSPFEPFLGNIIEADEAAADVLFKQARLGDLESLAIVGYGMGYWGREGLGCLGLNSLIASGLLQRLTHLRLERLPLGDQGVAALAPALGSKLERLELCDVYCRGAGAAALIESPCVPYLRHLDLSGNRIDAEHFARMASVDMPHLESLDLSGPAINPYYWNIGQQPLLDAGAVAWVNSPSARGLKRLALSNCHLTDEALISVFKPSRFQNLSALDLSHSCFTATAIAGAVVGSSLWHTLRELRLNDCRLDNAAIEALSRVNQTPALRSLQLAYNSIGPRGAAALANWPVLSRVWHLDLHDNAVGDDGLRALANSPYLGRLLELDLEQDCWNSRGFTFNDETASILAQSQSLPRLDALFSGCVDEYHGAAYSPGFSKAGLHLLRKSQSLRPACQASCSDFSKIHDYYESPEFQETDELGDGDFRGRPFTLNETEAEGGAHRMQQIRSPFVATPEPGSPAEILAELPPLEIEDDDVIEGIEFLDPMPQTDDPAYLTLSLEDDQRPVPAQAGKYLSDTLGSIFQACSLGSFECTGMGSELSFSVGIAGDPLPALQLIREALWWVGAPEDTDIDLFPLELTDEPPATAARHLQFATPAVFRWNLQGESGHRIDRVPFSEEQRHAIRELLASAGASESSDGWTQVTTDDGGRMALYTRYLDGSKDFDALNVLIDALTLEVSRLVYRILQDCGFFLLPMAFVANAEVARTIDCDWPRTTVVASPETLHDLLSRGPFHWWSRI